jgi:hypothetical protein
LPVGLRTSSPGRLLADGLDEFVNGGKVGQVVRVLHQMVEGDERVRLAAAIGQLELAHGLVVLVRQAQGHVAHQVAQVVRGEGQAKETFRFLVDRLLAALHQDLVKVRREHRERQVAGLQVFPKLDHFVPGFPG